MPPARRISIVNYPYWSFTVICLSYRDFERVDAAVPDLLNSIKCCGEETLWIHIAAEGRQEMEFSGTG
jgi:hypothetical protein